MLMICLGCTPEKSANDKMSTKRVALTYDDAPRGDGPYYSGSERTHAIINQLQEAETGPVVMFVTTRGLDKPDGRERITAYAQSGHLIANHSDTHMWASRSSIGDYIADIDRAEAKLEGIANRRRWFRFPYLDEGGMGKINSDLVKRDALRSALVDRDLMSGYVTIDTYDWYLEDLWKRALRKKASIDMKALSKVYTDMVLDAANHYDALSQDVLGRRPAHVLLLHENDLAAKFTKDLVQVLHADGWMIIDPDEAFADPIATQIPKTRFSGMGRISALAADAGLKGADVFSHWSVSEKAIEARVANANVFKESNDEISD